MFSILLIFSVVPFVSTITPFYVTDLNLSDKTNATFYFYADFINHITTQDGFKFHRTPFMFEPTNRTDYMEIYYDPECVSVIRNTLFSTPTCVSPKCPTLMQVSLEHHWYGNAFLCVPYRSVSLNQRFVAPLHFFKNDFVYVDSTPKNGSDEDQYFYTIDYSLMPTKFNNSFYIDCNFDQTSCFFTTKFCYDHYSFNGFLPESIILSVVGDFLRMEYYDHSRYPCVKSTPFNFNKFPLEKGFFPFPLFVSIDIDELDFPLFRNNGSDHRTPMRIDDQFVSDCSFDDFITSPSCGPFSAIPAIKTVHTVHIPSALGSYVPSGWIVYLINEVESVLQRFLQFFITLVEPILEAAGKAVFKLVSSLIPEKLQFYFFDYLMVSLLLMLKFDAIRSLVFGLFLIFFKFIIYELIKQNGSFN
jgi:hypothetical protein